MKANFNNPIIQHKSLSLEDCEKIQNKRFNVLAKLNLKKIKGAKEIHIVKDKDIFIKR